MSSDRAEGRSAEEVTLLLGRLGRGDTSAEERLFELLHGELRRIAAAHMDGQSSAHTLQVTALINEAWMRLARQTDDWRSRDHFLAVASRAMRSVLVDHARRKQSDKRGGSGQRTALDESLLWFEGRGIDLLALDEALTRLARTDAQLATTVDLLYFGGLSMAEVATSLGVSTRTIERQWRSARAFLHACLGDEGAARAES